MQQEAFELAERAHDDRRRVAIAREMAMSEVMRGRHQEAERWAKLAAAILARIGNPPDERASLAVNIGWLKLDTGQRQVAAAAFLPARWSYARP